MNPKVSILVPIYNVEAFIERCAVSLFEQTFEDIEYIFVNDCSPDNSIDILNKVIQGYPNRLNNVKIVNHERNRGLAAARNTGIENAKGEYVLHVDSDDYIESNSVELLYSKALEEGSDLVVSNYILEWENVSKIANQNVGKCQIDYICLMLSSNVIVGIVNKLIKRRLYLDNKIRAYEGINLGEDYLTTPRLAYFANNISKVNSSLYHYIQTNTNSYTKNYNQESIENIVFVMNELTSFFKQKPDYYLYKESILQGKIRKKIEIIFKSDSKYWNELFTIFPETKEIRNYNFLSKREKLIYFFVKNNQKASLLYYKKAYNTLFNLVQKLKGR